jgi:hypothetical protein
VKDRIGLAASIIGLLAAVASAAAVYIKIAPTAPTNPESPAIVRPGPVILPPVIRPIPHQHR